MLSNSHPFIRRVIRFLLLPYCFFKLINWQDCCRPKLQVASDLLYIFFRFRYYPDNYGACRFWEKTRAEWSYYYGSTYNPYPRQKIQKFVHRAEYKILFNDKELCEYYCRGLSVDLPYFYGVLDPGEAYNVDIASIFSSNKILQEVIIKPALGNAGQGIMKAVQVDGVVMIKTNEDVIPLIEFVLEERSIVQSVIQQHGKIAKISPFSVNTIRVVTLWTHDNRVVVVSAAMRFGLGDSFVDNWSAGGVSVGVDCQRGVLREIAYDKIGNQYVEHPVSKVVFDGFVLPHWNSVLKLAEQVQESCPFYRLIGCDIAISDDGPVLIEINANPDIVYQEQTAGPILANKEVYDEFAAYGLLINDFQKKLYD